MKSATATNSITKTQGQGLNVEQRNDLVANLVEEMLKGYQSDRKLSTILKVSRKTVVRYKHLAMKLIAAAKLDQPQVRALQMQRLYQDMENLTTELKAEGLTVKDKMSIYNQRAKINQQIALIAGLNIETKINIDHKKLVITRAHPDAIKKALHPQQFIDIESDKE